MITRAQRRAVRRVATARLVSVSGSGAAWIALAFILFRITQRSSTWVAALFLLTFGVQGLLSPLASALGDHFDRRRILVLADLAAAGGFLALALMRSPGQLLALAFVTAALESPIWAVSSSAIPNLVDEADLTWANGVVALGRNMGEFLGPILGGGLVAVMAPDSTPAQLRLAGYVVFGTNALSFLLSAWLVGTTEGRFNGDRERAEEFKGLRAGFVFLVRDRVLRSMTLGWSVLLLGVGTTLVAEVALADAFHAGSIGYGALASLWGGGAVVGALLARWKLTARHEANAALGGVAVLGLGLGLVSIAPWLALAAGLVGLAGMGDGFGSVGEQAIMQRRTPDEVRSRVMGATETSILLALAVSFAFGGALVQAVGPRWAYALAGCTTMLGLLIMFRPLRDDARARYGSGSEPLINAPLPSWAPVVPVSRSDGVDLS